MQTIKRYRLSIAVVCMAITAMSLLAVVNGLLALFFIVGMVFGSVIHSTLTDEMQEQYSHDED